MFWSHADAAVRLSVTWIVAFRAFVQPSNNALSVHPPNFSCTLLLLFFPTNCAIFGPLSDSRWNIRPPTDLPAFRLVELSPPFSDGSRSSVAETPSLPGPSHHYFLPNTPSCLSSCCPRHYDPHRSADLPDGHGQSTAVLTYTPAGHLDHAHLRNDHMHSVCKGLLP